MKTKLFFKIAFHIVAFFVIGGSLSIIPDHIRYFLGDTPCQRQFRCGYDAEWDWGKLHYWYFWMMLILFILSLINTIALIAKSVEKEYDL